MKLNALSKLLDVLPWPLSLSIRTCYTRLHDDHDGKGEGTLTVLIGQDGDAHVGILGAGVGMLRFRTFAGGGMSVRTRNALVILAEAIRQDNEDRPQSPGEGKTEIASKATYTRERLIEELGKAAGRLDKAGDRAGADDLLRLAMEAQDEAL